MSKTTDQLPLVSVIMPAFNAERYIGDAIRSVLEQRYANWELIITNNASTDGTEDVIKQFNDPRVRVLYEPRKGVSRARNLALEHMNGDHFCFLDADDMLPPNSLSDRVEILLADPDVNFVDGRVDHLDHLTGARSPMHTPSYRGDAFPLLMVLSARVFMGFSWMIRRTPATDLRLPEHMTHAEDLAFYLSISRSGLYACTPNTVLVYRTGHTSAMSDIRALDRGYMDLQQLVRTLSPPPEKSLQDALRLRIRRVMFRGFLKRGMVVDACRVLLRDLFPSSFPPRRP